MNVGDRVRVNWPESSFHGSVGGVIELSGPNISVALDEQFEYLLPAIKGQRAENSIPFLEVELQLLDGTTPECSYECWAVTTGDGSFLRKRLPAQRHDTVLVFSSPQLAKEYMEKARPDYPGHNLFLAGYTWGEFVQCFEERDRMFYALLDHEYGGEEGVLIPIPRGK